MSRNVVPRHVASEHTREHRPGDSFNLEQRNLRGAVARASHRPCIIVIERSTLAVNASTSELLPCARFTRYHHHASLASARFREAFPKNGPMLISL